MVCRKFEGLPYSGPPPRDLGKEDPAFTYTGVDFAGPSFVREHSANTSSKVWICVYTCLVIRAVHIDIVSDLSTHTFLRCLKCFAARHGFATQVLI